MAVLSGELVSGWPQASDYAGGSTLTVSTSWPKFMTALLRRTIDSEIPPAAGSIDDATFKSLNRRGVVAGGVRTVMPYRSSKAS